MKKLFFTLAAVLLSIGAFAQTSVSGVVVDSQDAPVIGAGVQQVGNLSNGAVTDANGMFSLKLNPQNASLQVSCIGYVTQVVPLNGKVNVKIVLQEDTELLDDVVVVAFGQTTREAFTGSAGTMKADELAKVQLSNPAQALSGRVSGVQINNTSGQLGSSPSITIRGVGSIYSDTEPLIVVDGMPFDGDLNLLSTNDIESMTVLKDAASNALYGARGANGVIMITTKRGKTGDAQVTVDAKWGVNSNALQLYNTVSTQQFYEVYYKTIYNQAILDGLSASDAHARANTYVQGSSTGPGYMVYTVPTGEDFILQGGTMNPNARLGALYTYGDQTFWLQPDDWEEEGLQDGFRQEYNVSVSGKSDKISYYSSISYLDQEGIQEGSSQERLTARLSADYQAKKWLKVGGNLSYTKYTYYNTSEGTLNAGYIWQTIKTQAPVYPVYLRDANGNIMIDEWGEQMYDFATSYGLNRGGGSGGNSIFSNKYRSSGTFGNAFIAKGYADIKLLPELTLTINGSAYDYDRRGQYSTSPFVDYYTNSSDNGYLSKSSARTYTYNLQQLLNYNKTFKGVHNVNVMVGHEYYNYKYEYLDASGYNFGIDGASELSTVLNVNPDPSSSSETYNNEGYFTRAMYDYAGKYYASASFRRDASSRFSKDNRWGNFWSVGAAWMISKENFYNIPWMNSLKLKASLGSQGNDNIGNYLYDDSYTIVNNNDEVAFQWRQKGTEDITWETNTNFNTGLEFELFKSRISGSIDYFYRKTSDMLFEISTPPSIGYNSYWTNIGDMRNSGLELELHATALSRKNFTWLIDFNISHVRDKVLKLPDALKVNTVDGHDGYINEDSSFISKYRYFIAEGLPLYSWYLHEYAGVDKETGLALYYKNVLDDDGNITGRETTTNADEADYYLNGNAMADFYGGLGMTFNFYGFDLSFNLTYQIGGKAYDYCYQIIMHNGSGNQISTTWHKDILNAWTEDNTDTDVPRLNQSDSYTSSRSDRFLVNASYLNFQNVNIGYTIPSSLSSKMGLSSLRVYMSAENLYYLSVRRGFDPRYSVAGYNNMSSYNPIRTISGGITVTF